METDVAVADLHEIHGVTRECDGAPKEQSAGAQRIGNAGSRPSDVFQKRRSVHCVTGFTTMVAFINGWSSQKYLYVPGLVNVWRQTPSVSNPLESKSPVLDVTV